MKVIWGGSSPTIQQVAASSSLIYFYKGSITDESSIDFTNEDLCEAYGFIDNDDKHYIFDNETELLAWASNLPSPTNRDRLVSLIEDRQAISDIAVNTGAQAYAETHNEELPKNYTDQVKSYWTNKYGKVATVRGYGFIWDTCNGGTGFPVMPGVVSWYPNWIRNKMSKVEEIGTIGSVYCTRPFFFGRKWYFNPLFNGGGVFAYCLNEHWMNNNQMSSIHHY